jgi:hypothetical protein
MAATFFAGQLTAPHIDYLIWAVQRNLIHGESRYLDALRDKYESIMSLYDESGAQ